MNKEGIRSAITFLAVIITVMAGWNLWPFPIKPLGQLGKIKKIYIGASLTTTDGRPSQIRTFLKNQLEQRGFVVSQRIEDADAVMNIGISGKVVFDGDGSEKSKTIYHFELNSPGNQRLWKCEVKVLTQSSRAREDEEAARGLAEKREKE